VGFLPAEFHRLNLDLIISNLVKTQENAKLIIKLYIILFDIKNMASKR